MIQLFSRPELSTGQRELEVSGLYGTWQGSSFVHPSVASLFSWFDNTSWDDGFLIFSGLLKGLVLWPCAWSICAFLGALPVPSRDWGWKEFLQVTLEVQVMDDSYTSDVTMENLFVVGFLGVNWRKAACSPRILDELAYRARELLPRHATQYVEWTCEVLCFKQQRGPAQNHNMIHFKIYNGLLRRAAMRELHMGPSWMICVLQFFEVVSKFGSPKSHALSSSFALKLCLLSRF